jgi:hypothetical protein
MQVTLMNRVRGFLRQRVRLSVTTGDLALSSLSGPASVALSRLGVQVGLDVAGAQPRVASSGLSGQT